jgi:hypothetical protein
MDINIALGLALILFLSILITYFVTKTRANNKLKEFKSISEGLSLRTEELSKLTVMLDEASKELTSLDSETKELQELKENAVVLAEEVSNNSRLLETLKSDSESKGTEIELKGKELHELMSRLDLYVRLEEFADNGHFEVPEYLYETSARFAEEIKRVREKQKDLIKNKAAVTYPNNVAISADKSQNKKILDGQVRLMLSSFNIECDTLIGKVSPSSYPRTLERIEKLANTLEKSVATLHCGFNIAYVEHKYEECTLQYHHTLKKQEEQDEQRQIREQIREEQKAIREYEAAIALAEKEERMYRDMLKKAREELSYASEEDKIIAEQKIADLERKLAEAEEKEKRAKSMAEQTRKGHVYIISNIGSFGEDIYKIGLTRRLEPMDRVKELGDASVPFAFDVHAMIYVEDAPALESALHREFTASRVNAVNLRKEFFRTDLNSIKNAVERIAGIDAEFKMTVLAEQYYESRRLRGPQSAVA